MTHTTHPTADGNGDQLDAGAAAALLEQATRQARRQLEPSPPWMLVIRAILVFAGCGTIWLSVRGQHPYRGPSAAVVFPVVAAFVAINFGATVAVAKRATVGVSGRSRLRPAEIVVMAVIWVGVFVGMGVLAGDGVSRRIVYGQYPTSVPLIAAGLAWAGIMAVRANRRGWLTGVGVAAVGVAALVAGAVGGWLVAGIGLCLLLLGSAIVTASRRDRGVILP